MDSFYSLKFILIKRKIKEQCKTIQMKMTHNSVGHVNTEYFPFLFVCRNAKQRKRQRTVSFFCHSWRKERNTQTHD